MTSDELSRGRITGLYSSNRAEKRRFSSFDAAGIENTDVFPLFTLHSFPHLSISTRYFLNSILSAIFKHRLASYLNDPFL